MPEAPSSAFKPEEPPWELTEDSTRPEDSTEWELEEDFSEDFLDVFLPDDEPERLPEKGDFWIERD